MEGGGTPGGGGGREGAGLVLLSPEGEGEDAVQALLRGAGETLVSEGGKGGSERDQDQAEQRYQHLSSTFICRYIIDNNYRTSYFLFKLDSSYDLLP